MQAEADVRELSWFEAESQRGRREIVRVKKGQASCVWASAGTSRLSPRRSQTAHQPQPCLTSKALKLAASFPYQVRASAGVPENGVWPEGRESHVNLTLPLLSRSPSAPVSQTKPTTPHLPSLLPHLSHFTRPYDLSVSAADKPRWQPAQVLDPTLTWFVRTRLFAPLSMKVESPS